MKARFVRSRYLYLAVPQKWARAFRSGLATADIRSDVFVMGGWHVVRYPNNARARAARSGFLAAYLTIGAPGGYMMYAQDPRRVTNGARE